MLIPLPDLSFLTPGLPVVMNGYDAVHTHIQDRMASFLAIHPKSENCPKQSCSVEMHPSPIAWLWIAEADKSRVFIDLSNPLVYTRAIYWLYEKHYPTDKLDGQLVMRPGADASWNIEPSMTLLKVGEPQSEGCVHIYTDKPLFSFKAIRCPGLVWGMSLWEALRHILTTPFEVVR